MSNLEIEHTKNECLGSLKECQKMRDKEESHEVAETSLCEFLKALGFNDIVEEYEKVGKWYA